MAPLWLIIGYHLRHTDAPPNGRSVESIVLAARQLMDAYERMREGERQYRCDMDALVDLCTPYYPDVVFVEPIVRAGQLREARTGQQRVVECMRRVGYEDEGNSVRQLMARMLRIPGGAVVPTNAGVV